MKVSVIAHASSKKPRIESKDKVLHVYIHAPSEDGKANAEIKAALALYFSVAKSQVILKKGITSKSKIFEIC